MIIMRISADYWKVTEADREVGTVTGDGPTAATRFKAITPEAAAINPDVAPGAYFETLNEAAEWLAHGRAEAVRKAEQDREDERGQEAQRERDEQWRAAGAMPADDPWWDEAARQDAERKRQEQILRGY